ncbi:MAG TPA: type II toxin-antitoxin system VapC family toxin [Dongiaceae bacterium]|nr:type II toxin-antitoxin system VapC family toxin [Dongiaceae bacterium]
MIGLDTNVLVRYIVHDDALQGAAATKIIESLSSESPGFIPLVVIAELVRVLQFSYACGKQEIAMVIERLLRSAELVLEKPEVVEQALRAYRIGRADFADCLIDSCAKAAGCEYSLTFDKRAATLAGMHLVP